MSGWDERDDIDRDVNDEHGVTYRLDGEGPAWDYADLGRCDL